ncbi:hypothetical protein [Kitasatospora sp. NPDC059827]|uniref:hypothetical protein n=1 Tax=Kitasatospora sp. NPDC059827 TaxID=3346964 RepID=UPI0036507AF6
MKTQNVRNCGPPRLRSASLSVLRESCSPSCAARTSRPRKDGSPHAFRAIRMTSPSWWGSTRVSGSGQASAPSAGASAAGWLAGVSCHSRSALRSSDGRPPQART